MQVAEELSQQGLIFFDPGNSEWAIAEEYLSGNVKAKLELAKNVTDLPEWIASTIPRNIEALEKVQPLPCIPPSTPNIKATCANAMGVAEITPELLDNTISARLGANWISAEVVHQFVMELLKLDDPKSVTVIYAPAINQWEVNAGWQANCAETNKTVWGTPDMNAIEIISHILNLSEIKLYRQEGEKNVVDIEASELARAKADEINAQFKTWLWQDEQRAIALTKIYNDRFNNLVDRRFDGSHLELPGSNPEVELRPHQMNGVWRILQSRSVLLPYKVGYGKTFTMVAGAMELRRLKLANKPMLVVLNSTVGQIAAEFKRLYPTAKLLVASKESFAKAEREKFVAKIALHDWDCVIIAHSQFFNIKVSEEAEQNFLRKEASVLKEAIANCKCRGIQKALERRKRHLSNKISEVTESSRKDDCIEWEKLGVDALIIDESQFFKNLSYTTRMHNVAGLPNSHAQRSMDTFMKVRQTLESGGRVVFSTGTPVSNSVAELFTMQRYLDLDYLEEVGLNHFDAWATQFGETVTAPEITPSGSYKSKTRFARFCNLPELMRLYSRFADFPSNKVELPLPELSTVEVAAPPSDDQNHFLEVLAYRANQVQRRMVEPQDDNMLKITSDGRKASLEIRLVDPSADNHAQTKVNQCAWNVWKIWQNTKCDRSTQLIFCDFSTPNPERHNVYRYLKDLLIGLGVKASEVALIHSAKSDDDRSKLFEKVRAGQVRVLLGSTEKLGTGVNVQDRLIAEHHLDAPWRPSDVEQRTGRTRRQGNKYSRVWSFRYVTKGNNTQAGFDSFLWQTLETKAKFIAQVSNGNINSRTAEDVDEAVLSFAQVKAMASGNPVIMEKAQLDAQYHALKIQSKGHEQKQSQLFFQIRQAENRIETLPRAIANIEKDLAMIRESEIVIGGQVCNQTETNKIIRAAMRDMHFWGETIGYIGNFSIKIRGGDEISLVGNHSYIVRRPNHESIHEAIAEGIPNSLDVEVKRLAQAKQDLVSLNAMVGKPFEHTERMEELRSRLREINLILQQEQADKPDIRYCTDTACAEYIAPELEIIAELKELEDRPTWLSEILDLMPKAQPHDLVLGNGQRQPQPGDLVLSNIIEFPIQKIMEKPQIISVEYKFEAVKTRKGEELTHLQGCLF
jgi:N12 class adenine-specific DNA methylase